MENTASVAKHAGLFRALGNPNRLKIYSHLLRSAQPQNVSTLEKSLEIKQSHLSQSLNILNNTGLIRRERDGSKVFYSINKDFFSDFNTFNKNFFKKVGI